MDLKLQPGKALAKEIMEYLEIIIYLDKTV